MSRQETVVDRRSLLQDRLEVAVLSMRCFCAVALADDLRQALTALQSRLARVAPDTKWVEPPNLHLTLGFFGELSRDRIEALVTSITRELTGLSAVIAPVRGAGAFPSPSRARVLWVGVGAGDLLGELSRVAWAGARAAGIAADSGRFSPHITLGRVREPRANEQLRQALAAEAQTEWGVLAADRIVLYASQLSARGPTYTEIASWTLPTEIPS